MPRGRGGKYELQGHAGSSVLVQKDWKKEFEVPDSDEDNSRKRKSFPKSLSTPTKPRNFGLLTPRCKGLRSKVLSSPIENTSPSSLESPNETKSMAVNIAKKLGFQGDQTKDYPDWIANLKDEFISNQHPEIIEGPKALQDKGCITIWQTAIQDLIDWEPRFNKQNFQKDKSMNYAAHILLRNQVKKVRLRKPTVGGLVTKRCRKASKDGPRIDQAVPNLDLSKLLSLSFTIALWTNLSSTPFLSPVSPLVYIDSLQDWVCTKLGISSGAAKIEVVFPVFNDDFLDFLDVREADGKTRLDVSDQASWNSVVPLAQQVARDPSKFAGLLLEARKGTLEEHGQRWDGRKSSEDRPNTKRPKTISQDDKHEDYHTSANDHNSDNDHDSNNDLNGESLARALGESRKDSDLEPIVSVPMEDGDDNGLRLTSDVEIGDENSKLRTTATIEDGNRGNRPKPIADVLVQDWDKDNEPNSDIDIVKDADYDNVAESISGATATEDENNIDPRLIAHTVMRHGDKEPIAEVTPADYNQEANLSESIIDVVIEEVNGGNSLGLITNTPIEERGKGDDGTKDRGMGGDGYENGYEDKNRGKDVDVDMNEDVDEDDPVVEENLMQVILESFHDKSAEEGGARDGGRDDGEEGEKDKEKRLLELAALFGDDDEKKDQSDPRHREENNPGGPGEGSSTTNENKFFELCTKNYNNDSEHEYFNRALNELCAKPYDMIPADDGDQKFSIPGCGSLRFKAHQVWGIQFVVQRIVNKDRLNSSLVADDMGMGKTFIALGALFHLKWLVSEAMEDRPLPCCGYRKPSEIPEHKFSNSHILTVQSRLSSSVSQKMSGAT